MSLERVESCPVCGEKIFQPFLECEDYTATHELFHVEQCPACGMLVTNPRPHQLVAGRYYQSPDYISHRSNASGIFDYIYLIIRYFTLKWKYSLIKPYLREKTLLDVGCGTGDFLYQCQKRGLKVFGVEPAAFARARATSRNVTAVESLETLPDQKFDVITLWHVLEHIYDLHNTLNTLKEKLANHGTIFIAVPNWQSFDASRYQNQWAGYDVPRHVWHFSKASMTQLLENTGLRVQKILPMKLDAYYVSLLSEKNSSGGKLSFMGIVCAVMAGYQSNAKASSDINHSSLIYIVQK
jgi:2-polyprenyl-3-methyl-5-hydroxy-6-metoxy-1,4-benzoquinol methylase